MNEKIDVDFFSLVSLTLVFSSPFLIIGLVLSLLISCKKKGCTDPTATNYNQHAEQNDGTCEYEVVENALPLIINENKPDLNASNLTYKVKKGD